MLKKIRLVLCTVACVAGGWIPSVGQAFPGEDENIPYLITFGKETETSWGDDDFSQTFFLSVPTSQKDPIYVRVFDPDTGGDIDEPKTEYNTQCRFSIYGGKGAFSGKGAKNHNPEAGYDSGTLLASKTFGVSERYDGKWYTFGPFNPSEGEYAEQEKGYVFKVICDGISGDDGNLYRYFLSVRPNENIKIEGSNAFTFEYTFRMPDERSICHIYPFVSDDVISVKQHNFDWDNDGLIRLVSVARKGEKVDMSEDDRWGISVHPVQEIEKNTSLDVQLINSRGVRNNNVVFRITNQYGESLPFYSIPIGGKPVYKANIKAEKIEN